MALANEEIEYYNRQIIMKNIGTAGQEKLKVSKVLIIGAGGLGSPAAMYLAGAGVGTIGIADFDMVSITNIHRQIMHGINDVDKAKVISAKEMLLNINPYINIVTHCMKITPDNIESLIKDYDFIIDAVDNLKSKFLINDACVINEKPFCHGGVLAMKGQVMTYVPGMGQCYRCIFEEIPKEEDVDLPSKAGITGPVPGFIGSIQALEAIKYLTGAGQLLTGKMLVFDGFNMDIRVINYKKPLSSCRVCGDNADIISVVSNRNEYL